MTRSTALERYARLEAAGLWRPDPEAQRREVIVSLGEASLTIMAPDDTPLAHWSLAAVERANPGRIPALYHPLGDAGETLELGENAAEMIEAIEILARALERRRPRPGRLRRAMVAGVVALGLLAAWIWLPDALRLHALRVLPPVKRAEIGAALLARIDRIAGPACDADLARGARARLIRRITGPSPASAATPDDAATPVAGALPPGRLVVVPGGRRLSAHLPGGIFLLHRSVLEGTDDPAVAAGFLLAEDAARRLVDPLDALLRFVGTVGTVRLLATGRLSQDELDAYAAFLMTEPPQPVPAAALAAAFARAAISPRPWAEVAARAEPNAAAVAAATPIPSGPPVLGDSDWVRLQAICEP